jgi:hypothetical protein
VEVVEIAEKPGEGRLGPLLAVIHGARMDDAEAPEEGKQSSVVPQISLQIVRETSYYKRIAR